MKPPVPPCERVRAEASKYTGWNVDIIVAISQSESTGCDEAARGDGHLTYTVNGRVYGYSLSVLQVRILPGREHCDTHDLKVNVRCAHAIWQDQGYEAWTDYKNGKYKRYL